MHQQAVTSEQWVNEQPWAGIPSVDGLMECPNCGWKGHNSELVVSGFETDFVDEVVSGECSLECPGCRADAGHMLYGWSKGAEIAYCEDDLQIARMATNILAHTLENTYQISKYPDNQPVNATNESKKQKFVRRRNAYAQKTIWKRKTSAGELRMAAGFWG